MSALDTHVPLKSVDQLAAFLGVSKRTVYRHCRATDPALHWDHEVIAGKFRFTASQVERILTLQCARTDAQAEACAQDEQVVDLGRIVRAVRRRNFED